MKKKDREIREVVEAVYALILSCQDDNEKGYSPFQREEELQRIDTALTELLTPPQEEGK